VLSHPATLLEKHLQHAILTSVRLHPAGSQQGDTVGWCETLHRFSHFPAGKRSACDLPASHR
jgi:hypothetical protein